jgi:hypothetical protein
MDKAADIALRKDPEDWGPVDMWGLVNELNRLRPAYRDRPEHEFTVCEQEGNRPVRVCFARPSRVQREGYSWDRHVADETIGLVVRSGDILIEANEAVSPVLMHRLVGLFALAAIVGRSMSGSDYGRRVEIAIGDSDGGRPLICFSTSSSEERLIPDPYFVLTRAYEKEKEAIESLWSDWTSRKPAVYWRGSPTGLEKYARPEQSQRVRLVTLGSEPELASDFNVKFSTASGFEADFAERLLAKGLIGDPEPQMAVMDYRYQVDVDGVSSSWTGLFIKLLTGAPVLKVESDRNFRQWYYPSMRPWIHYVPVSSDLSDLASIWRMLSARPDVARGIGAAGRDFALGLDFASQLHAGASVLARRIGTT